MMQEPEKTIVSDCGKFRAEIKRRAGGALQVKIYKWTEEWVDGFGKVAEFWEDDCRLAIITDTQENAERLAKEELRCRGDK